MRVHALDRQITQEQVLDILPLVTEVNAISEELNKYQTFDVVLMTVAGHDGTTTKGTKLAALQLLNLSPCRCLLSSLSAPVIMINCKVIRLN